MSDNMVVVEFAQVLDALSGKNIAFTESGVIRSGSDLCDAFETIKRIEAEMKIQKAHLLEAVLLKGGTYAREDFPELGLIAVEREGKRVVDPVMARPVLYDFFVDEEFPSFTTVSISKAEKALKSKTPKGDKDGVVERLNRKLKEAGAITRKASSHHLEVKAIKGAANV